MTYRRIPGPDSRSGPFAYDFQPMGITRVQCWPRVGATSLVFYDNPTDPHRFEQWRQSSRIVSITEIPPDVHPVWCGC
jgi:hypothetical protein